MDFQALSTDQLQAAYAQLRPILERAAKEAPDSQWHEDVFAQAVGITLELIERYVKS